jgi:hypothetical protein
VGYLNPATGTYVLSGNFANMKGQGLDVQLNTKNLSGNLSWVSSLNFSYATDKVTRYDQQTTLNYGAFASGGYDVLPKIGKTSVWLVFLQMGRTGRAEWRPAGLYPWKTE